MKKSIKQEVIVRVALILLVVIVTGLMTINGMKRVKKYSEATGQAADINALVLTAEKAHYGWVENLCSSISMGTEFTGSTNYQTCVHGTFVFSPTPSSCGHLS